MVDGYEATEEEVALWEIDECKVQQDCGNRNEMILCTR